jgi:hypothetical protein
VCSSFSNRAARSLNGVDFMAAFLSIATNEESVVCHTLTDLQPMPEPSSLGSISEEIMRLHNSFESNQ